MSLLGTIGNIAGTLLAQRSAAMNSSPAMVGRAFPGTQLRLPQLPAPGAGYKTGGQFGTTSSGRTYVGGMRKRRRTNPTNVRALRRALSRVEGFIRIEKRVDKILRKVAPRARAAAHVGFVKRKR